MVVLLVLYPLSIGPAAGLIAWLGETSPAGKRLDGILTVVYLPIVWIAKKSPIFIGWLTTYMGWFMR